MCHIIDLASVIIGHGTFCDKSWIALMQSLTSSTNTTMRAKLRNRPLKKTSIALLLMALFTLQVPTSLSRAVGTVRIDTHLGPIRGEIYELPDGSSGSRFLGIRYARPPIGSRRFKAPEPSGRWENVYDATSFGPSCHQPDMFDVWMMSNQPHSFAKQRSKTAQSLHANSTFPSSAHSLDDVTDQDDRDHDGGSFDDVETYPDDYDDHQEERNERSADANKFSGFNGENAVNAASAEFSHYPGQMPGHSDADLNKHINEFLLKKDKRYLVQNYLHDVSEDCLSLNVYTPRFSKIHTRSHRSSGAEQSQRSENSRAAQGSQLLHFLRGSQEESRSDTSTNQLIESVMREVQTDVGEEVPEFDPSARENSTETLLEQFTESDKVSSSDDTVDSEASASITRHHSRKRSIKEISDKSHFSINGHKRVEDSELIQAPEGPLLPVMVYVHGGSYFGNAGRLYPGEKLASTGMVVVTLNYRLGAFGFLSTGDASASGNWGLRDQRLALQWVQDNIASYGGDPDRVLLAGNSAGGASVLLHLMSPLSEGLFSRAAAMSGSTLGPWAIQAEPLKFARRLADSLDCNETSNAELVDCLRAVDASDIMKNFNDQLADGLWISFAAVVEKGFPEEEAFLPHHPYTVLLQRTLNTSVPVLLTFTKDEVSIWYRQSPDELKLFQIESWIATIVQNIFDSKNLSPLSLAAIIHAVRGEYLYSLGYKPSALNETPVVHYDHPAYIPKQTVDYPQHFPNDTAPVSIISQLISDVGLLVPCIEEAGYLSSFTKVYLAQFVYVSPDDIKIKDQQWIGAYHEHELQYLFGLPYWGLRNTLQHPANKEFSNTIMTIFRQFAEQGVPNGPNGTQPWPQYVRPGDAMLSVGLETSVKYNYLIDRVAFWKRFVPLMTRWPIPPLAVPTSAAASTMLTGPGWHRRLLPSCRQASGALSSVLQRTACIFFAQMAAAQHTLVTFVGPAMLIVGLHRTLNIVAR